MFWNLVIGIASLILSFVLRPKPQNAKPASLVDFNVPISRIGQEIPVVFGTVSLKSPNIVWYGDLEIHDIKGPRRYGFFGPRQVTGHQYFLGMHMVLCHGVHDEIREIWAGDQKIFPTAPSTIPSEGSHDIFIFQPNAFGGDEREGGIVGFCDILDGRPSQARNDYLVSQFGAEAPAYRGVVSAIWARHPEIATFPFPMYIGNSPYLKNWEFVLKRIHQTSQAAEQWYDAKAAVPDAHAVSVGEFVPNEELNSATGQPIVADFSWHVSGDYAVGINGNDIMCWQYPDFGTALWITDDTGSPGSPQSIATDGVHVFVTYQLAEVLKVYDVTDGSLLATVTLTGHFSFNSLISVLRTGSTTKVLIIGAYWTLVTGNGASWSVLTPFDGPNAITFITAVNVGSSYAYGIKDGLSIVPDEPNVVYLVTGLGVSASLVEVTLTEISGTIFALQYRPDNDQVYVLDSAGYVHIYSADLGTLISSSGDDGWIADANRRHSTSNGMFYEGGVAFLALTSGPRNCIVQYSFSGTFLKLTDAHDDYVNGNNSSYFRSVVSNSSPYIVVSGSSPGVGSVTAWPLAVEVDALDMNPAHIIRECITDPTWGMGYADVDIDDDSFTAAADTLWDECFGLSLTWVKEEEIREFVSIILSHIDAYCYLRRSTGKFYLKLIRNDYDINTIVVMDEDDVIFWEDVKHRQPPEAISTVTVQYVNRRIDRFPDDAVPIDNIGQIQAIGERIGMMRNYPGISRGGLAVKVGERDLKTVAVGVITGRLVGKRTAAELNPGDPFRVVSDRRELDGQVMRVVDMKFGDGRNNQVTINFIQDVFRLSTEELVDTSVDDWEDITNDAEPVEPRLVWEAPYYEMGQLIGATDRSTFLSADADGGILEVAGARPTSDAFDAKIYVGGVTNNEIMSFTPSGTLLAGIGALDTTLTLDDTFDSSQLTAGSLAALIDASDSTNPALIEVVSIDDVSALPDVTIGRGFLDTVPRAHALGKWLVVFNDGATTDFEQYTDGQTINVALSTRTGSDVLSVGAAPSDSLTFDSRAIRPLRPADAQVDGNSEGVVDATALSPIPTSWARRNRLTELSPLAWDDADVTPEASQTTTIRLLEPDGVTVIDDSTYVGIAGTTQAIDPADFNGASTGVIEFSSVRDGYSSWQAYQIAVLVSISELLLEGDESGALLLEGDESGSLLLEGL